MTVGVSSEQALASMHCQYADGELIHGAKVFPEAYRRVDLPFLAWLFSRPYLELILNLAYRFFAKFRHQISWLFGPGALWLVKKILKFIENED